MDFGNYYFLQNRNYGVHFYLLQIAFGIIGIFIGNRLEILEDNKKIIRYPIENINNNARIYRDYYVNYNKYFINYKQNYIIEKRLQELLQKKYGILNKHKKYYRKYLFNIL